MQWASFKDLYSYRFEEMSLLFILRTCTIKMYPRLPQSHSPCISGCSPPPSCHLKHLHAPPSPTLITRSLKHASTSAWVASVFWEGITSLVQQENSASSSKWILLKQALGRQKYNLFACSSCLKHAKSEWYKVCILTIAKSQASLACGGGGGLHQIFPPI